MVKPERKLGVKLTQNKFKQSWKSTVLGENIMRVLSFLPLQSYLKCAEVSSSWKSLTKLPYVQSLWCSNMGHKEAFSILHRTYQGGVESWSPTGKPTSNLIIPEKVTTGAEVVASAGGLVCFQIIQGDEDFRYELYVGNPHTNVWKDLPPLNMSELKVGLAYNSRSVRMEMVGSGYKILVQHTCSQGQHAHVCYVYDSRTGCWTGPNTLSFSSEYVRARKLRWDSYQASEEIEPVSRHLDPFFYSPSAVGFYDLQTCQWKKLEVSSLALPVAIFTLPTLEPEIQEEPVLPLPGMSECCMWEFKGEKYFASAWINRKKAHVKTASIRGFGVWKVSKDQLVEVAMQTVRVWCKTKRVWVSAQENLVCFTTEHINSGVQAYNLQSGEWRRGCSGQLHLDYLVESNQSVIYRPSVRSP